MMYLLFAQTVDFEKLIGNYGLPTAILILVFIFVIIPIAKAQVAALTKVTEAMPDIQAAIQTAVGNMPEMTKALKEISEGQKEISDSQKKINESQVKLLDKLDKMQEKMENVCKVECSDWTPHRTQR